MAKLTPTQKNGEVLVSLVESMARQEKSLTRLETLSEATTEHLKRLNGSVAKHEIAIGELKATAIRERAKGETNAAWLARLSPIIWLAIGGIAVLFLVNAKTLIEAFTHISHP